MPQIAEQFFLHLSRALRTPIDTLAAERHRQTLIREFTEAENLPQHMLRDIGLMAIQAGGVLGFRGRRPAGSKTDRG